jgi:tRNA pseudouridine55 synthase
MTSFDVIRRLRRRLNTQKLGHTGTLDPLATGVLCVGVGWVTRLFQFMNDDHKVYRAIVRLGQTTETDDAEGDIIEERVVNVGLADIEAALPRFTGDIEQRPPIYSAIKVDGQRAYKKARKGQLVELAERPVRIDAIKIVRFALPEVTLQVTCGKGTYIRSLCRDLGESLGCGAHLAELRRLESGAFSIDDAVPLEEIDGDTVLIAPVEMLDHLPVVELDDWASKAILMGQKPTLPIDLEADATVRAVDSSGSLLAVARVLRDSEGARLKPVKVRPTGRIT